MAEEMTNIEIRDFLTVSGAEDADFVVLSLVGGTSAKIGVGVFQSRMVAGIKPSIRDGVWWIGEDNQEVLAEGLTPEFKKTSLGIEWKYTNEASTAWRLLVPISDILFKFDELTAEQRDLIKLKYSDLTEEEIKELQKPASDMIAQLEATDAKATAAEAARVEAEAKRVEAEAARVEAETSRSTAETARDTAEKARASAEDTRKANETERIASESARKTAETARASAEDTRKSNEETRIAQEAARVETEKNRVSAETARVLTENDRVEEFARLKAESEAATSDAQDTADHPTYIGEDNYVYKWNKTAQTYDKTAIYVRGEAFSIKRVYSSIDDMYADTTTSFKEGDFCMINTGNVEDPENAQLFVRTSIGGWDFVVDMSGAIGFTGKVPQLFIGTVAIGSGKDSAAVTLSSTGVDEDGNPKYNINYVIPCLAYEDLTEEQIAELQRPASDMIVKLQATDDAVKAAEELRVEAEEGRVAAESGRVSAEENRVLTEEGRVSAEDQRVTNEASRISKENERIASEDGRIAAEAERVSAEETRMSNEDVRKSNEQVRVSAENLRSTAEQERIDAENARLNSEENRAYAEQSRVLAEDLRKQNEETRIANEDERKASEAERQETDTTRKEDYAVIRQGAVDATDAANTAALKARNLPIIQNGTWWLYDVDADTYVDTGYAVSSDYQLTREKIEGVFTGNVESHWHDRYVDKVEGKQLSTEDFTSVLKEKLEGLENYDDAAITAVVNSLRSDFDALVGGEENVSSAIETFNEIMAFLDGVEDTQSLSGIIASLQAEIAKKANPSDIPTKMSQLENDVPYATTTELSDGLASKQSVISDLETIRSGAALGATAIQQIPEGYVTEEELEQKGYASSDTVQEALESKQDKNLYFQNVEVSEWVSDTTFSEMKYRSDIPLEGVTSEMVPEVIFGFEEASSGNYSPLAETKDGVLSIWSSTNKTITIPTIIINK